MSLVVRQEWQPQGQHHVQHYPEGPYICFVSVWVVENNLGRAVREGAESVCTFFMWQKDYGQSEIYDLCYCFLLYLSIIQCDCLMMDQDILHLDVTVHYCKLVMQVVQAFSELADNFANMPLIRLPSL